MAIFRVLAIYFLILGIECMERRAFTQKPSTPRYHGGVTTCSDGWLPFEGSCYLFGRKAVDFTEAEHFCLQYNKSHLIHVDNSRENEFIKDHIHQLMPKNWWLGMTDKLIEGTWRWLDTEEYVNFSDWYPGQDHTQSEDCAIFWQPVSFKWADYSCLGHFYPICEARGTICRSQFEMVG